MLSCVPSRLKLTAYCLESFHERTNNERVLPATVDLAQQQQASGIQRLPGRGQRPGFDHQVQVNDHEFGDRPVERVQ